MSKAVSKSDLVKRAAAVAGVTIKDADLAVSEFLYQLTRAIDSGQRAQIHGLGTFEKVATPARKGRHPQTGETIDIPAGFKVRFRAAKAVR